MGQIPDPRSVRVPPPPADTSAETRAELAELRAMTQRRTANDMAQIRRWSVNEPSPNTHWMALADEMARKYRLSPPAGARVHAVLAEAIYSGLIAAWANKWVYLRPRPSHLDPAINVSVIAVPEHPSYPSGHATNAGAAYTVLTHFFPQDEPKFRALALDSGMSRLKAGIHYRSDMTEGFRLGRTVAQRLLAAMGDDGAPRTYALPGR